MPVSELPPEKLRLICKPGSIDCNTSEELGTIDDIIGQERALRALSFGVQMKGKGFNVYAAGLPGTGKNTATRRYLVEVSKSKPVPPDWCYVNNFQDPYEPRALKFAPGRARAFQREMKSFIQEAKRVIPAALQSEEFLSRVDSATKKAGEERDRILAELNREAERYDFAAQLTQVGINLVPTSGGRALTDEEFQLLPAKLKEKYTKNAQEVRGPVERALKGLAELNRKTREDLRKVRDDAVHFAIDNLINNIITSYQETSEVSEYLSGLRDDILENAELFTGDETGGRPPQGQPGAPEDRKTLLRRYEVNIIVDNSGLKGAPVVSEENPSYRNLFGRIEYEARFGTLVTDLTLIKGGSLHEANGGFLILRVDPLLNSPSSYDGLKRALQSEKITIEEVGEKLNLASTKSLTPEPIPLDVKVVLIGDPSTYELLFTKDPDFSPLFKVKAHFDETIQRNDQNVRMYGGFVHTLCEREGLKHLEAAAIAKVVEYGSRLAEDQEKISTRFSELADIIRESNFYAAQDGSKNVKDVHITKALEEKIYRSNLIDLKLKEVIERGIILVDTEGAKVGQVNGLSVIGVGDFDFGQPSRITASVGLGREGIIDVERLARMGGQTHTKGVLIISGYLANKYASDKPLSLSCRLVFEQSYSGVDGDSASSTELYAILSSLADLPLRQDLAVTGSVNQKGEVQAIGGVNEKIEGFYAVCKAKGLTGDQGVVIPQSNVQHLMLKEEVVEAVRQGKFHVYPVSSIDEGIEILTGVKASERGTDGGFEPGTVHHRVNERLTKMAETITRFGETPPNHEKEEE